MATIQELLLQAEQCNQEPLLASRVVIGLLEAIEHYNEREGDFGQNESERRIYRNAALAVINKFFSHPGLIEPLASIDPDESVNNALLEKNDPKCIKMPFRIKQHFCSDRYTHKFVDEWYAERRYAIGTYGSIVVQLPSLEAKESKVPTFIGWCFSQGWVTDALILLTLFLGWLLPPLPRLQWAGVVYPSALVLAISVWVYLCVTRGAHVLKAMVPRLAACVVVGLALPLATRDVWTFSFHLWEQQHWFWVLIGALLVASWLYLFIETFNHVGKGCLSAVRAFHILLRLCNFALFSSWWATSFISTVAPPLVKSYQAVAHLSVWSLSLDVPVPTSMLFAAFAVFIGIFLQVLWHDLPITSKL